MNAILEKIKIELPEEFTLQRDELDNLKPALNPKSGLPLPKPFTRRLVIRWKNLGYEHQHPAPDKSGSKIKRPHG
jgi:hypothetical protein